MNNPIAFPLNGELVISAQIQETLRFSIFPIAYSLLKMPLGKEFRKKAEDITAVYDLREKLGE